MKITALLLACTWAVMTAAAPAPSDPLAARALPSKALIGYLHSSFKNGAAYIPLANVSDDWDIINLSFAEPTSPTDGNIQFRLCPQSECANVESESAFIAAVDAKKAKGKLVQLSIGGQNGLVQLTTTAARDRFVSSVSAIVDRYHLNGVDVDFEGHSLSLNANDVDFTAPTTPQIVNLISALKTLKSKYGSGFGLTMAPETFFVQLGGTYYGPGPWGGQDPRVGSYLPVIHALRDSLTVIAVQDYNSGSIPDLNGNWASMGSADFHVQMTDFLLNGFVVANNNGKRFPPLRPEQVAFGVPSAQYAGNGFIPTSGVQQAVLCLTKRQSCGSYAPKSGGSYPGLRGVMTWSINWDEYDGGSFRKTMRPFLNSL